MPGVQTSNLGGSMNPSGGVATSFGSSMPNIAQQQTWNNPSWTQQAGAWLGSDSMSQGMGLGSMSNMNMILQADQMGGQLMGLLAGQNESTVGNIVKSIPGLSTVGNLINAAFGSHINEEFVRQTVLGTNAQKTKTFNSNTNSDVLNDWRGFNFLSNVTKDEVGSDGWFSNKAKNKTNELNNNINAANDLAILNFGHAVDNADANSDLRIAQSMVAAYGGPINSFRKYYRDGGSPYTVGATINSLYAFSPREEFLGEPSHHYDFTQSEEWANAHGYYPDARGHRDDRVKKPAHPSHPSRGAWKDNKFELTDLGMQNPNYTLFGLNDGGQDPQATLTYRGGVVLPEITVTPKENYIFNPYDNIILHQKALGGNLFNTPQFFTFEPQIHDDGGYLSKAKALIRQNEGWREKPYKDAPKGKNWRSVGYGFNDSGFREKYPEGISKHYEHGITKKQAEEELNYFLNKAEKQLKSIYGKQWNDFTDSQKAAILDTYYQRPASVAKGSRFYKAITSGEDAGRYLGVAGYDKRNKIRQGVFGGDYSGYSDTEPNPSALQEVTPIPVIQDLNLEGITPTQAKALELNLSAPAFDLSMFGKPSAPTVQPTTPTVGTVEDFLSSYGDFEDNLFDNGGWMDFFNAWNQAQGGNNYFGSNNWKPSDGLQTNTSNGSVQDWMGVASSVVNTVSNWGKEDPSLGRGGGYSQFGMAAYDLMKTIRDATKHRKEPMDRKLGIPIYAQGGHLFSGGGNIGALGYANIANSALKLASNVKHQTELDIDPDKVYRSADRYGMGLDEAVANVNTNGDLLDLWANNSTVSANLSGRDFRNKSYFDDFLDSYAASWEGFNAGQNFGPWGAAIGAVIGGGSSVIGSIIGRNKAEDAAEESNRRLENANERRAHNLIAAAERVDEENDLRILQNMDNQGANGGKLSMGFGLRNPFIMPDGTANPLFRAFGGGLTHGSDWDTGINWVNEGGSHGENPLGGVQMGVDEQGVPNLVEEGEAIWNGDYVFSKRMKVPKKLAKKYGLGGDMTFADAIAKLTKDSEERPLSNIDRVTNDHILGEFADSQEELRMAKAQRAMDKEIQLQDDFLTGFQFGLGGHMSPLGIVPDADNISPFEKAEKLFADGGGIHIDPSKKGTFKAQASKMGMGVQEAASHILAHKENYSPEMVRKANFARNASHWHEDGGFLNEPFLEANTFDYGGALKWLQEHYPNVGNKEAIARVLDKRAKAVGYRGTNTNDKVYGYQDAFDAMQAGNKPIDESNEKLFESLVKDGMPRKVAFGLAYPQALSYPYAGDNYGSKHSAAREAAYNKLIRNYTAQVPTSNRGNNTRGRSTQASSTTATPAVNVVSAHARGTQAAPASSGSTGTRRVTTAAKPKATSSKVRNTVGSTGLNYYGADPIETFKYWNKETNDYDEGYRDFIENKLNDDWITRVMEGQYGDMSRYKGANKVNPTIEQAWQLGLDGKNSDWHKAMAAAYDEYLQGINPKTGEIAATQETKPAITRSAEDPEWAVDFGDPEVMKNIEAGLNPDGTTPAGNTGITRSPFKPKQTWTRYAPMVMSGLMGLKEMLTPADYANADAIMAAAYQAGAPVSVGTEYIGDYRRRDPFDERYLMNIINQRGAATNRNMMNLSGGNRAAAMAGILSNDLTTQMSLAEAARQAYLANRADDADVAAFNKDTNKFNATAQNTRNLSLAQLNSGRQSAMLSGIAQGARLRQAIKDQRDAAIAANLSAFAQGLGDIGWENYQTNQVNSLYAQGYTPYWLSGSGKTEFK